MAHLTATNDIREAFLRFFEERGHVRIPSAPLVPENDPTTLFTGSGMQPLVPYLLGQPHPHGTRLVNSQKSFRAQDVDDIGDNRHTTFFEMLGNWSLGDYFKEQQLPGFWGFLTDVVGLDPQRLYVTVFAGDAASGVPRDEESAGIWQQLFREAGIEAKIVELDTVERGSAEGMQDGRIFYYGSDKNWWSRAGAPEKMPAGEPGGPDSEVFYEFTSVEHDPAFGEHCHPNCDCGRFLEIGNSVFMEYQKQADGSFTKLKQRNVDFGGGLERISAAALDTPDVFALDVFQTIFAGIKDAYGHDYAAADVDLTRAMRVIADHLRAAVFLIGDGVEPSNKERGYIVRRLLRRAIYRGYALAPGFSNIWPLVERVPGHYRDSYPELEQHASHIRTVIEREEAKFLRTLARGAKRLAALLDAGAMSGSAAFELYATYGFPLELIQEEAQRRGVAVDVAAFEAELEQHRASSRQGAAQKFKGGLADHSAMSVKYHTATHLLHKALQEVLGPQALQRGSNITPERLRFDFAHPEKMTAEQIEQVEQIVNAKIAEDLPVWREEMPLEEARARGAMGLFDTYGERVSVYGIGDWSLEMCGGPHVTQTGGLGRFRITKEESAGAGVRRIRAELTPE